MPSGATSNSARMYVWRIQLCHQVPQTQHRCQAALLVGVQRLRVCNWQSCIVIESFLADIRSLCTFPADTPADVTGAPGVRVAPTTMDTGC